MNGKHDTFIFWISSGFVALFVFGSIFRGILL